MSRERVANALKFLKCMYMDAEKLCVSVEYVSEIASIQRSLCKYRTYSRRQWHYMLYEKLINIRLLMFTYFCNHISCSQNSFDSRFIQFALTME